MDRKRIREQLIQARMLLDSLSVAGMNAAIAQCFKSVFESIYGRSIGCYWPIKGEFDSIPLMMDLHKAGSIVSLPEIDDENAQLTFRQWHPEAMMARGRLQIAFPVNTDYEQPEILLIPLVGFDLHGYRLGCGGGYYDRTLHHLDPPPITIGIGYEAGLLDDLMPRPGEVPMEFVLTENGLRYFRSGKPEWITSSQRVEMLMRDLYFFHFRSRHEAARSSPVCYDGE